MINIQGYIVDHWLGKMDEDHPVLTVYDPSEQYAELLPLASDRGWTVIDTRTHMLESHMAACDAWVSLPDTPSKRILIYRKKDVPTNNNQRITEPYIGLAQVNSENFPFGPKDQYINLCKAFLHGKEDAVDKLFHEQDVPSFSTINTLLDGASYPELEAFTKGKSLIEITVNLLSKDNADNYLWVNEWNTFATTHYPNIDTNGASLDEIQEKLWQYLLFSEFVLDLPGKLPTALQSVAYAPIEKRDVIYNVCKAIRNSNSLRPVYVEQAQNISKRLQLDQAFASAQDLGKIVTFAFENRVEYQAYLEALNAGDFATATSRFEQNQRNSLWYESDKEVATFWNLVAENEQMQKSMRNIPAKMDSLSDVVNWYAEDGYNVDLAFRRYQTLLLKNDFESEYINSLTKYVHAHYRSFTEHNQEVYQNLLYGANTTKIDVACNISFWNSCVAPLISKKKRVAIIMADAFRYEMGKELEQALSGSYSVICSPSVAFIPTVTRFGMAALLPNAEEKMKLDVVNDKLQATFNGKIVELPADRINYIKENVPTHVKVQDIPNAQFIEGEIENDTNLLIIRSVKIDTSGESIQSEGLSAMETEQRSFSRRAAALRKAGFDHLFVVADHGYMIQPKWREGDFVEKPVGTYVLEERRCLAGDIADKPTSMTFTAEDLRIQANVKKFAFAKGYGVYTSGKTYFHEGLSLQENIVPVVSVALNTKAKTENQTKVELKYRGKKEGVVRTLMVKIEISLNSNSLFTPGASLRISITNKDGKICGEPIKSSYYDDFNELINIPQDTASIYQSIELIEDQAVGDITITVYDAETNMTKDQITLQTDFDF